LLIVLTISMSSILAAPVTAAPLPCSLSVKILPTGSGTVTLTPPGLPAGTYNPCVPVSFKATPSAGYYFVGWALSSPTVSPSPGDGNMYYFTYQNPTPSFLLNSTSGGNQRLLAYFQAQNQWVRPTANPVLTSSSGWDDGWVGQPRVFTYPDGTYGMIYVGNGGGGRAFGLATSPDGVHWTKYAGNPILSPGSGGDWDSYSEGGSTGGMRLGLGSVFWDASQNMFLLYYSASNSTDGTPQTGKPAFGLATSTDSIHWTKYGGNPILSNGTEYNQREGGPCGSISQGNMAAWFRFPDVVKVGSTYYMWYNRRGAISFATSSDGYSWNVQNQGCSVLYPADWDDPNQGAWPNLPHAYSWDGDFVYYPSVFYDPVAHDFKMFYSGMDVDYAIIRTGFATSTDGIAWTRYAANPVLAPMAGGFDNSDSIEGPSALLVNGQILAYYDADTLSSMVCREGYDPACVNYEGFTALSIGLAYVSEVPLFTGWNLVSPPVVPNNNLLKSILAPQLAAGEVTIVWSYTGTPRSWQKFIPPSTGTLTTMMDGNGYWIYMTKPDTLLVGGTVIPPGAAPPAYKLLAGWNLVGFKPQPALGNETVSEFLVSLSSGTYDSNHVWVWDNYAGAWTKADPGTWLIPGQALWIYVTSPSGVILTP